VKVIKEEKWPRILTYLLFSLLKKAALALHHSKILIK
jgi:hypothetical protein